MNAPRRLSVAAAAVLAGLAPVLVPAGTTAPDVRPVTVSLLIVETTPEALADAEDALGFSLDPALGRCTLSAGEQAKLTAALADNERVNTLGRATAVCMPGQEALFKAVEQIRVPARYGAVTDPDRPGKLQVHPAGYTTRDLGLTFEPHVLGPPSDGVAPIALSMTLTRISGWREIAPGTEEPIIRNWGLTTAMRMPLGSALVLVSRPCQPFEPLARLSARDNEPMPRPQPVVLIVIGLE